jgi:asparagine synthase (glutamine-hydrolysing)
MCGIAALFRQPSRRVPPGTLRAMNDAVAHRGPDGAGTRFLTPAGEVGEDAAWTVALGHRRLSILDLSAAGAQPMVYRGRYWTTYNGEAYDYVEHRATLEQLGHTFVSGSDTEVLLAAYAEWGAAAFARFHGMWGVVLVDLHARRAVICRDRLGIKPVYVWRSPTLVAVVSEPKQLDALPGADLAPDEESVASYLATGYEDRFRSFFAGVTPVPAGTYVTLDLDTLAMSEPVAYWHPENVQVEVRDHDEAARRFADTFQRAVRLTLRSDVPVGCALSGGLDSSSVAGVVAQLARGTGARLETFTITFPGEAVDEREWVDRLLPTLSARPHFVTPTSAQLIEEFDRFLWHHDEPVGSLSQYAGYCVARLTRQAAVPVTLNGQGGDEVLAGYWQYYFMHLLELARRPAPVRLASHFLGALTGGNPELVKQVPWILRRYRARRHADALVPVRRGQGGLAFSEQLIRRTMAASPHERRLLEIRDLHLPRLLKWDDRNFMAHSVEGRYPFLDHGLIETCLAFDQRVLYDRGWVKEPLRRGLVGTLPASILRRRSKVGLETPQQKWLAGPLRETLSSFVRGDSPVWSWVEPGAARALAERAFAGRDAGLETGQALFRLWCVHRWAQRFERPAAAARASA